VHSVITAQDLLKVVIQVHASLLPEILNININNNNNNNNWTLNNQDVLISCLARLYTRCTQNFPDWVD